MADTILLRSGKSTNMPTLASREIAYTTDEKALYVGNVKLCSAGDKEELDGKLTATPLESMSELPAESDLAAVIGAYNSLISALKANGMMKEVI